MNYIITMKLFIKSIKESIPSESALKDYLTLTSNQQELLKYIAIVMMVVDHITRIVFNEHTNFFNLSTRFVFPVFVYLLTYNYLFRTKNKKEYLKKILITALISQPIFMFSFDYSSFKLNVLFDLFYGLFILYSFDYFKKYRFKRKINVKLYKIYIVISHTIILYLFGSMFTYNYFGIILIITTYYFLKTYNFYVLMMAILILTTLNMGSLSTLETFSSLLILPIFHLIKQTDLSFKRINSLYFYMFFPLHLAFIKLLTYL